MTVGGRRAGGENFLSPRKHTHGLVVTEVAGARGHLLQGPRSQTYTVPIGECEPRPGHLKAPPGPLRAEGDPWPSRCHFLGWAWPV